MEDKTFIVTKNAVGRLDLALVNLAKITRSQAQKAIKEHRVNVNTKLIDKNKYEVHINDVVKLHELDPQPIELIPENINLDIVYEDEDVIVVNKPQGMVVHPAPGHPNHTLVNALLYHSPLSTINGEFRPGIVHRIDKDTSGLLMVAKNDVAHQSLAQQLQNKTNIREYIALVHGTLTEEKGTINAPIGRSKIDRKKMAVVENGRHAVTHFEVLKRYANFTLIKCILETGRTHQIRVHLSYIGHPVVDDPLYGTKKKVIGKGQLLHAYKLGFKHPRTGEQLVFTCDLPNDFKKALDKIKK